MMGRIMKNGIFYSIQGEGILTGIPSLFIRLAGCNLRCSWCDSPDTLPDFDVRRSVNSLLPLPTEHAENITVTELYERVKSLKLTGMLTITGGEPWLQPDFIFDIYDLFSDYYLPIYVETNGTIDLTNMERYYNKSIYCTFSPKKFLNKDYDLLIENLEFLRRQERMDNYFDCIKIVVSSTESFYEAIAFYAKIQRGNIYNMENIEYYIQLEDSWLKSGWEKDKEERVKMYKKLACYSIKLGIQQHKVLGVD